MGVKAPSIARRLWDSPTVTTWAALGTNAARFLVILPLVLTRFSAEDVAVWYLIAAFLQIQSMLDFGLSWTGSRFFSYAMGGASDVESPAAGTGRPNHELLGRLYSTLARVTVFLGLAIGALLALIGTPMLAHSVSLSSRPDEAWLAWAIMLVGSTIGFCAMVAAVYLQGANRVAVLRRWEALTSVGAIITTWIVLSSGGGLVEFALIAQLWNLAAVGRNLWLARKTEVLAFARNYGFDRGLMRAMWSRAWKNGVGVLLNAVSVRLAAGILAALVSPVLLAAYLLAFNVLDRINMFAQAPFYSRLPRLAALYSGGQWTALKQSAGRGMVLTFLTFVVGAIAFGAMAEPLLGEIDSSTPFIGLQFWVVMAVGMLLHRVGAMFLHMYTLTNHVLWHIADGVSGIVFTLSWMALFPVLGIDSIAVAFVIAYGGFFLPYSAWKASRWFLDENRRRARLAEAAPGGLS